MFSHQLFVKIVIVVSLKKPKMKQNEARSGLYVKMYWKSNLSELKISWNIFKRNLKPNNLKR